MGEIWDRVRGAQNEGLTGVFGSDSLAFIVGQ